MSRDDLDAKTCAAAKPALAPLLQSCCPSPSRGSLKRRRMGRVAELGSFANPDSPIMTHESGRSWPCRLRVWVRRLSTTIRLWIGAMWRWLTRILAAGGSRGAAECAEREPGHPSFKDGTPSPGGDTLRIDVGTPFSASSAAPRGPFRAQTAWCRSRSWEPRLHCGPADSL